MSRMSPIESRNGSIVTDHTLRPARRLHTVPRTLLFEQAPIRSVRSCRRKPTKRNPACVCVRTRTTPGKYSTRAAVSADKQPERDFVHTVYGKARARLLSRWPRQNAARRSIIRFPGRLQTPRTGADTDRAGVLPRARRFFAERATNNSPTKAWYVVNDTVTTELMPGPVEDPSPHLAALRDARQRAAEARSAAERAFREAQAAEADLIAQEEQAIVAAAAAARERLAENARLAAIAEREAVDRFSALRAQIESVGARKASAEAAVAGVRASLAEREEELRAAEINERALFSDLSIAERQVQESTHARELAEAALHADAPAINDIKAQRAAERRIADALRAASG